MSERPGMESVALAISRALGVKEDDPATAFRDLTLPPDLVRLLSEPLRDSGFELTTGTLTNPYESRPVSVLKGPGADVYLLHVPGSILEQPTDEGQKQFEALAYLLPAGAEARVVSPKLEWVHPRYLAIAKGLREGGSGANVRVAPWAGIELALMDRSPDALRRALGLVDATGAGGGGGDGQSPPPVGFAVGGDGRRDRVFISFSPVDRKWRDRLVVHLKPLERAGLIKRWDQAELQPGDVSAQEVATAVSLARVAVLLVSADFISSDAITDTELPSLVAAADMDQASLIALIVGDCLWTVVPALSRFTPLNGDHPLNKLAKGDRETVLKRVAQAVMAAFGA